MEQSMTAVEAARLIDWLILAEANQGDGLAFPKGVRFYVSYILPLIVLEDDQACHKGHAGVQHADAQGFAGQPVFLADIAAEDGDGSDAQGQGEEGLAHGGENHATTC